MAITYMTPAHRTLVDSTLVAVHNRATELINAVGYALGKNPPEPTIESARQSPLGRDLEMIVAYVEGHSIDGKEIDAAIQRVLRIIYGYTLNLKGYKLLKDWQKTPLGELIGEAYTRLFPPKDLMGTAEVQRAFGVKRQTVYDWVDEGRLTAYYIHGKQMFYRPQIRHEVEKRARAQSGVQQL
jgi:hypothetical protein